MTPEPKQPSERRKGNSRLVVKDGRIVTETVSAFPGPEPVQMQSHRAAIWPDGQFGEILIVQGSNAIRLTMEQAESLAKEIVRRLP